MSSNKDQVYPANPIPVFERQPMVLLVCGETGVGKTYRNKLEIKCNDKRTCIKFVIKRDHNGIT